MSRFFNTTGPNNPLRHYTLPILTRLPQVRRLIEDQLYFVVHAPRQVGKTTTLSALAKELTAEGQYTALLFSAETGAGYPDDPPTAEAAIVAAIHHDAHYTLPKELRPPPFPPAPPGRRLIEALSLWAELSPRPLVVFIDEIDSLQGNLLISILRQLRDGYRQRPQGFPWSLAVIGMRNVRDYKIASGGVDRTHSASPFNIAAKALTLSNFTRDEVRDLYGQHTEETGQVFLPGAVELAFELSQGQPWLVNALANEITESLVSDRTKAIGPEDVNRAKEILIRRQDTHLDSLAERLREPRIQAIMEPMLSGDVTGDLPPDDIRLATDLGLLRAAPGGRLEVANPMYREMIVRQLSASVQQNVPILAPTWLTPEGKLNKEALLESFLSFWRQHGEPLFKSAPYHEVAPHLVLMAFLHRVVNGGSIEREYSIGSGRMDLCVRYGGEVLGIELKVWRAGRPDPEREGLEQLDAYLKGIGQESGWLVIFDRRPGVAPVEERLSTHQGVSSSGRLITVVRA